MNEPVVAGGDELGGWDRFWFSPASVSRVGLIRGLLALLTAAYFLSCWSDAAYWYSDGGPFSPSRVATFLRTSGLEDAAVWIVSPLFLTDTVWVYHLYLAAGVVVALMVALGRGSWWAPWGLWLLLVGWANRAMILSGLAETMLSLGLFASAVAPPCSASLFFSNRHGAGEHWRAGFSQRVLAVQVSLVLIATFVTMLGGRVWFNGLGAFALAAPAPDRTIDWTRSLLANAAVHEGLTHLMMLMLPIGLLMAWNRQTHRSGQGLLLVWCLLVMLLGSFWLYGLILAVMVLAIQPVQGDLSEN